MSDALELSDAEFLKWAGNDPRRWASLPGERREAWLDYLVARMKITSDGEQRSACWKLANVIARADAHAAGRNPATAD